MFDSFLCWKVAVPPFHPALREGGCYVQTTLKKGVFSPTSLTAEYRHKLLTTFLRRRSVSAPSPVIYADNYFYQPWLTTFILYLSYNPIHYFLIRLFQLWSLGALSLISVSLEHVLMEVWRCLASPSSPHTQLFQLPLCGSHPSWTLPLLQALDPLTGRWHRKPSPAHVQHRTCNEPRP